MKKSIFLFILSFVFIACSTKKTINTTTDSKVSTVEEKESSASYVQFREDFTKVSETTKTKFLEKQKATATNYAVLFLTHGYKGEHVIVKSANKKYFEGTTYTVKSNDVAGYLRVKNDEDLIVTDNYTNKQAIIESKYLKEYKFVYVLKDNANKAQPYKITYSNSLRPL